MTSAYDRWATRTPADWDDELAYLEHEAREQGEADVMQAMYLTLEAQSLVILLDDALDAMCSDWDTEHMPATVFARYRRICNVRARAEKRFERREAK